MSRTPRTTESVHFIATVSTATINETPRVLTDVADERVRQTARWGVQSLPDGTGGTWKTASDHARRITDERTAAGVVSWLDVLLEEVFEAAAEDDHAALREELVQVAAVATSWVEDIDRKAAAAREVVE